MPSMKVVGGVSEPAGRGSSSGASRSVDKRGSPGGLIDVSSVVNKTGGDVESSGYVEAFDAGVSLCQSAVVIDVGASFPALGKAVSPPGSGLTAGEIPTNNIAAGGNLVGYKSFAQTLIEGKLRPCSGKIVKPPAFTTDGEPAVFFTMEDIADSCEDLLHAVIAKCSYGRPSIPEVKSHIIQAFHLDGVVISRLDPRHLLIRLNNEEDFIKLLLQKSAIIKGFLFRFFKWQLDFDFKADPPVIPAWISLPGLPANFFREDMLKSIASNIGPVLRIHDTTLAQSNTTEAIVCVELNLEKVRRDRIWIGIGGGGYWQNVDYRRVPTLCSFCHKIGHIELNCRKKTNKVVSKTNEMGTLAQKQGKQEFRPKKNALVEAISTRNKFGVLHQLEDDKTNEVRSDSQAVGVIVENIDLDIPGSSAIRKGKSVSLASGSLSSIQEELISEDSAAQLFTNVDGLVNISSPEEVKSVLKRRNVGAISSISLAENSKMLSTVSSILQQPPKMAPPSMFPGDLLSDVRLTRAKAKVLAGDIPTVPND